MSKEELIVTYAIPALIAILGGIAAWLGAQLKGIYQTHVNDKTKRAVVRICVKAAEQLYHELSGPEKLKKAQEGIVSMLNEKGIPISELEMNALIESVVCEFNYGFGLKDLFVDGEDYEDAEYVEAEGSDSETVNEEEGASL